MPASSLPTRSAPTSAAFVKMPPPSRAKTEMREPPNARPIEVVDRRRRRVVQRAGQEPVVAGDAEQAKADDEQPGHRARLERDVERRLQPAASSLRGPGVRAHGHVHPDEAGGRRKHRSDQEPERGPPTELVVDAEQDERHHGDDRDRRVLLAQVRRSAFLHGRRDLPHPLVAGGLLEQPPGQVEPVRHGHGSADEAEEHGMMHEPIHPFRSLTKSSAEVLRRGRLCITSSGVVWRSARRTRPGARSAPARRSPCSSPSMCGRRLWRASIARFASARSFASSFA